MPAPVRAWRCWPFGRSWASSVSWGRLLFFQGGFEVASLGEDSWQVLVRKGEIGEVRDQVGRPVHTAGFEPGREEAIAPMLGEDLTDQHLIGFGRGGAEGEANLRQPQFEQPVAPAALAVIVALGRRPREDLDLAVVEAEAAIDRGDLRLHGALVRQQQPGRAGLDDRRRDGGTVDVAERLRG